MFSVILFFCLKIKKNPNFSFFGQKKGLIQKELHEHPSQYFRYSDHFFKKIIGDWPKSLDCTDLNQCGAHRGAELCRLCYKQTNKQENFAIFCSPCGISEPVRIIPPTIEGGRLVISIYKQERIFAHSRILSAVNIIMT